jgi:predicted metalloprotease
MSTTDGLDHVLAGVITIRDPTLTPDTVSMQEEGHGSALDRVGAFQMGFDGGADTCAKIDLDEITKRRGNLPLSLQYDQQGNVQTGEAPINDQYLQALMDRLGQIFSPSNAPKLSTEAANCSDAQPSKPASYCPASNTITVDMSGLQEIGKARDRSQGALVQGDTRLLSNTKKGWR